MKDLRDFDVTLREYHEGKWLDEIIFECSAEDHSHADEQADNAYPNCIILKIELVS
jgi:hypothetical protein